MSEIRVPVSAGELLDKITILRIKSRRMSDARKLENVRRELSELEAIWTDVASVPLPDEEAELTAINERLWDIEDEIREQESRQDFGVRFVWLARQVYFTNDRRAAVKRHVNLRLGSLLVEEKSYAPYDAGSVAVTARSH